MGGVTYAIRTDVRRDDMRGHFNFECIVPTGLPDELHNALAAHIEATYRPIEGLGGLDGEEGTEKLLFDLPLPPK